MKDANASFLKGSLIRIVYGGLCEQDCFLLYIKEQNECSKIKGKKIREL